MRILLLYDNVYADYFGGVEQRNYSLARALQERGHEVVLAGFVRDPSRLDPQVPVLDLGRPGPLYDEHGRRRFLEALDYGWSTRRIEVRAYDAVETASLPFLHLPSLSRRCRAARVPLVVTWYEFWGTHWRRYRPGPSWRLFAAFERKCATAFGDRLLSTSRLTAQRIEAKVGRTPDLLPVGLRVEEIAAAAGTAGRATPLLSIGRLIPDKRLDLILEAVANLRNGFEPPLLRVIGDGPDRDRLQRLAARLGISQWVEWSGHVAREADVWHALGSCSILVHASAREGFGIVPLEAMAAGRPVVCCESSESAVPELVDDGVNGRLVAAHPETLAAALLELLRAPDLRLRMGEAAHRFAQQFSWDRCAARFESIAAELVARARSRPHRSPGNARGSGK